MLLQSDFNIFFLFRRNFQVLKSVISWNLQSRRHWGKTFLAHYALDSVTYWFFNPLPLILKMFQSLRVYIHGHPSTCSVILCSQLTHIIHKIAVCVWKRREQTQSSPFWKNNSGVIYWDPQVYFVLAKERVFMIHDLCMISLIKTLRSHACIKASE